MSLPALGNSLLKALQTIQDASQMNSAPIQTSGEIAYVAGLLKGYEQGYKDGLHAFEPLVPSGFKTPYRNAIKMLQVRGDPSQNLQTLLKDAKIYSQEELK